MVQMLILLLVLVLVVFPLWAIIRIISLGQDNRSLTRRLAALEEDIDRMRQAASARQTTPATPTVDMPVAAPLAIAPAENRTSVVTAPFQVPASPEAISTPHAEPAEAPAVVPPPPEAATSATAPTPPTPVDKPLPDESFEPPPVEPPFFERIDWEQFMGVKLFAWLGGFAAFLAAAFFVKYSFEHNLIPPEVRVAIGFLFAIGLVIGGLRTPQERYAVTAQTLIATGIVSLYAVTFACNSIYHFALFGPLATFLVMALVTTTAFLLAVRLDAKVIAILGMLGGFLTPVLLSTGHDNPPGLFGYLALLDVGLIAVALHRRWHFLIPLSAVGTIGMQIGWAGKFFGDEKAGVAMIVCLGYALLFVGACALARRRGQSSPQLLWSAAAFACVCFGFALYFNVFAELRAQPLRLFTFVLLADLCLFALAWVERQPILVAIAATGATLIEIVWVASTLSAERAPTAMVVSLGFCLVFLAAYWVAERVQRQPAASTPEPGASQVVRVAPEIVAAAAALPFVAFALAFAFVSTPGIAARPGLLFTFVLLADACVLALAWRDERLPALHLGAGGVVFALLAYWTNTALQPALLSWALAFYLLYGAIHTAFPLVLERRRPAAGPRWWSQLFPPVVLGLMFFPLFKLEAVSLLFWPGVLLVDVMAVVVALCTASLIAVAAVLLLTLGATAAWMFQLPATLGSEPELLVVVAGFALVFFGASFWLGRRLGDRLGGVSSELTAIFGDTRSQLPAFSALLPFILLVLMTQRLPLANPSPVFGLALLLTALTLGLAVVMTLEWLPACALVGVAALEYAWRARHLGADATLAPLLWYLGFYAVFSIFPFLFRRRFAGLTGPWAIAALAGVAQFPLVYDLFKRSSPNGYLGILPALFAILPLLSLASIVRSPVVSDRARLNQLAWFGGIALLFITLIFPIQWERQWLTLAWALEGVALLWLYHRVPHPGLRFTGVALLVTGFARLALNPAVLEYYVRSGSPVLNWYLYTYGLVTAALFVGARLLASPRERVLGVHAPALLNTLGTVLAFLLVNIEIADAFSAIGTPMLTFEFSGNFARDMSYTIAWALFALGLLLVSIWKRTRAGRYAALTLLGIALAKLFLHDLARLDSLYRIGALFAVALIAIAASVAYQRFLPGNDKTPPSGS